MEHSQPVAAESEAAAEARRLIAAVENIYRNQHDQPLPTAYRDTTPTPVVGTTPPETQPGRAPMSQKATDISGVMLAASAASVPIGGMTALVLYVVGQADTVNLAIGGAAPIGLVVAVGGVLRGLKGLRTEIYQYYSGPVRQENTTITTNTRGLLSRTRNQLH